jgi:hypothetical protein
MKRHLFYLLATAGAYSAVTTVLIGRWIERNSQVDDELDELAATPTPPVPATLLPEPTLIPIARTNGSCKSSTQRLREQTRLTWEAD